MQIFCHEPKLYTFLDLLKTFRYHSPFLKPKKIGIYIKKGCRTGYVFGRYLPVPLKGVGTSGALLIIASA